MKKMKKAVMKTKKARNLRMYSIWWAKNIPIAVKNRWLFRDKNKYKIRAII